MEHTRLSDRELQVLTKIIKAYIASGDPVSSRAVVRGSRLGVSAATVRNVMASLEERGMLCQPHTSAGRIPTIKALKLYVRDLVRLAPVGDHTARCLDQAFDGGMGVDALIQSASRVLSVISTFAGLASSPSEGVMRLKHIDLIGLSDSRILVVVVTEGAQVRHQIVDLDHLLSPGELLRMSNFLNEVTAGLTLDQARLKLHEEIKTEKTRYDRMLRDALKVGHEVLMAQSPGGVVIEGELSFLSLEAVGDLAQARKVLGALREKRMLLDILDRIEDTPGAHVLIGTLGSDQDHDDAREAQGGGCSLIVAPYTRRGERLGWVGVVGPVRMRYRELIPLVECAAMTISHRLEKALVA